MKILVCVKQVPESDAPIRIDDGTGWIHTDKISGFRMNRLDEFAVEAAVLIKEACAHTTIDAITVGPTRSSEVIRRTIGMGADSGIHIVTESEEYQSSFKIAAFIADYARNRNYDLILTGAMSEDNMQGQVGPMIAGRLALPWATSVILEKIAADEKTVYVEREIEGGSRHAMELQLPAVLTIQSGINTPRYPSLSNLLRANRLELEKIHADDLAQDVFPEILDYIVYPQKTRSGTVLKGTAEEKAGQLVRILREKALLP
ncbi:MAG: electron transfer flavoprotein subunit beta/FixA family protein [Desulfobacterales bacterium]|nr:MAG: electron transfer flavoprotein subunit beta/FixA family protein [Desulfobacterales bacterium]